MGTAAANQLLHISKRQVIHSRRSTNIADILHGSGINSGVTHHEEREGAHRPLSV
jgi:hypothetical protein